METVREAFTFKINFKGGLISPGELLLILQACRQSGISNVSFGSRQQLFINASDTSYESLSNFLKQQEIPFEVNDDSYPNIVSSYPAEEIFITKTWLSEGVYKDILDSFDYKPRIKVNVADSRQSITPMLTGNINWIASPITHFWHLVIRFPKTNIIYHWKDVVYTNDIAAMSKKIEQSIIKNEKIFIDNSNADGDQLYENVMTNEHFITKKPEAALELAPFQLPYYEGLNKYQDKYWLGIYRRNEQFPVKFLMDVCTICLTTKIGQICSTPWKSIIIKGIEEKDYCYWNDVLGKHQINMRHAANELNFQVEDDCPEGLDLKYFIVKNLSAEDARTFGICFGIKTRRKSEVFCNILIRKKSLFTLGGVGFFNLYDILLAKDFNPNERTGKVFSKNNLKFFLPEQVRLAIVNYYQHSSAAYREVKKETPKKEVAPKKVPGKRVHQCKSCMTVYDKSLGEPDNGIVAGTSFEQLPPTYTCPTCDERKMNFIPVEIKEASIL